MPLDLEINARQNILHDRSFATPISTAAPMTPIPINANELKTNTLNTNKLNTDINLNTNELNTAVQKQPQYQTQHQ